MKSYQFYLEFERTTATGPLRNTESEAVADMVRDLSDAYNGKTNFRGALLKAEIVSREYRDFLARQECASNE